MICIKRDNISNVTTAAIILLKIMYASACHETTIARFYILIWTSSSQYPFTIMKMERKSFTENECQFQNCFITSHILQLSEITHFDAVLFNAETLRENPEFIPPNSRDKNQKYVLVSTAPSATHQLPVKFNSFFNWTWTYKLNSDVKFAYIAVKDSEGTVIGPGKDINWIPFTEMQPTSNSTSKKLKTKINAAAWYISDCGAVALHLDYIKTLRNELRRYYLTVDILGPCGKLRCGITGRKNKCSALIEANYYFYLAFENHLREDYVTDQLLMGLNNYAVPVVYGGANYTRFMPDGIYLNALELGPSKLAKKMFDIISDRTTYESMFKWRKHYTYHDPLDSSDTNVFCAFCELLNNDRKRKEKKVYTNIVKWLNETNVSNSTSKPVLDIEHIDNIDKNRYGIVNGYDTLVQPLQQKRIGSPESQCYSVMSCAGDYLSDISKKVTDFFGIEPISS